MPKPTGFKEFGRESPKRRPVEDRLKDYHEFYEKWPEEEIRNQGARCMNCAVPFCHTGCPLGNVIPDWNDLVYRGRWKDALTALLATNNFPEFTGRICPAPCETSCVLSINQDPVTIEYIEKAIADRGFEEGWIAAQPPERRTGKRVAVVGSGPSGLAAAQQLNRAGHQVTVFERADRPGGLLALGIPDFKLDKALVHKRVGLLEEEGIEFRTGVNVGVDYSVEDLRGSFDAVCLCGGSTHARELNIPGRELDGIHLAMEYLPQQNMILSGNRVDPARHITAEGKRVVILGGGDTGADCLGTAHRQGAKTVYQFELLPEPPETRPAFDQAVFRQRRQGGEAPRRAPGLERPGCQRTAFHGRDTRQRVRDRRRPGPAGHGFPSPGARGNARRPGCGSGPPGQRQRG